ncbi:hypothetical protein [Acinetobacter sp.]|uniref:hypothetical protein n=1 Tax=Acinetobacter sp. TaxID=472 RepID=UPI0028B11224|nr:hypothetical protein [Acinetobacter sp.]
MPDSLPSTMTSLLALEDASPACHEFGGYLLGQTPSLEGLQSLLPDPDASSALEFTEIHLPDQKPHLARQPISSYLYCLKQFSPETQAYQWGVNTLIACCILISINPSAAAEHQATITTLVNRFRLASQALHKVEQNEKLFKYDKLYLWLWEQLPQTATSLEAFFQQLCELEQSGTLDTFQFNLIQEIRRAYSYVLNLTPKKSGHHNSSQRRLEQYALDESDGLFVIQELPTSEQIRSLQYEQLTDHQQVQTFQIDTAEVSPLCKSSRPVQQQSVRLMQQHIVRLQHRFSSSNHYPDLASIRLLITHCWQKYSTAQSKDKAYLIILLSFLTGNSTEEWLKLQHGKISRLNQRQRLIQLEGHYVLRSKFTLFDPVHFAHKQALQNQMTHFDLPLVNALIEGLKAKPILEQTQIRQTLQQCRAELHIPSLTSKKLTTLLHATIYHMTGNAQLADILTGIDANRSSSISYCSYPVYRLQREYLNTVQTLSSDLAKMMHIEDQTLYMGSLKAPAPPTVRSIFAYLYAQVIQAKQQFDFVAYYNHYNIWLWHILLLFTGARPVKEFPGLLKDFDLDQGWLWVSDKEIHGRHEDGRLLPLCRFLQQQLKCYLDTLKNCMAGLAFDIDDAAQQFEDILESRKPLLGVFIDQQWQALSPAIVAQFTDGMQLEQANWLRHTTRAFLTDRVDETLILALFGHEKHQQEIGNEYSSLALNRYKTLGKSLDEMQAFFQIDGMNENFE